MSQGLRHLSAMTAELVKGIGDVYIKLLQDSIKFCLTVQWVIYGCREACLSLCQQEGLQKSLALQLLTGS